MKRILFIGYRLLLLVTISLLIPGVCTADIAVNGNFIVGGGSLIFPDGSTQSTATVVGPQGPAGPLGPVGPAGPVGATGPQGPQGISGVSFDLSKLYQVEEAFASLATCYDLDVALSCGAICGMGLMIMALYTVPWGDTDEAPIEHATYATQTKPGYCSANCSTPGIGGFTVPDLTVVTCYKR